MGYAGTYTHRQPARHESWSQREKWVRSPRFRTTIRAWFYLALFALATTVVLYHCFGQWDPVAANEKSKQMEITSKTGGWK